MDFSNETMIIPSSLRNNPAYISIYLTWMKIIIVEAIPYGIILTLNICILCKVYDAAKYRQSFKNTNLEAVMAGSEEDFTTSLIHRRNTLDLTYVNNLNVDSIAVVSTSVELAISIQSTPQRIMQNLKDIKIDNLTENQSTNVCNSVQQNGIQTG